MKNGSHFRYHILNEWQTYMFYARWYSIICKRKLKVGSISQSNIRGEHMKLYLLWNKKRPTRKPTLRKI